MVEKISGLETRQRTQLVISKITTKSNMVRWQCMEATMKMFRFLKKIAEPSTYDKICRAYFTMSSTAPIQGHLRGDQPLQERHLATLRVRVGLLPGVVRGVDTLGPDLVPGHGHDVYVARFAQMLRMSYICSESGVIFVNCSPVITKTNCEECMAMPLFSEWLADVVEIHARNEYKVKIISMGELTDETVSDATKSSQARPMTEGSTIIRCRNPAKTAKLSRKIAKVSGESLEHDTIAKYSWVEYPKPVISRNLPFRALTLTFYVEEEVNNDVLSETESGLSEHSNAVVDYEDEDPFAVDYVQGKGKSYSGEKTSEVGQREKKGGPFGVTKHSQFAQLVDPTGQAVSQQSIVIDNIRKNAGDMVAMWKQTMVQIGNDKSQCYGIVGEYENLMKTLVQKMEIACARVEGLPAAVEGDYGIYTKETQPTAPNGIYDIVFNMAKDSSTVSKGQIISIADDSDFTDAPTKRKKKPVSRAPSVAPSVTSTVNTVETKEQGPMKTFVLETISIKAAQSDMDETDSLKQLVTRLVDIMNMEDDAELEQVLKTIYAVEDQDTFVVLETMLESKEQIEYRF
ncbi:hypothetical protein B0T18DRAFT_424082 [Schizothecium vesticola]|uniref:Uncharacterized protein n=1 Tax=Schizothecium vesticola TaxID=314040 RepID=A0AA40F9E5_9PEZI|nr:hypothetical protein B0T18DRAFT_424082 [Schizothecium vesticola]